MKKLTLMLALAAFTALFGCSGGSTQSDAAWNAFETGDYATAHLKFAELVAADSTAYDGLLGLGWTTFRMSSDSLDRSLLYFHAARLADTANGIDAYAGLTFASWPDSDYVGVIQNGDVVLGLNDGYVFVHDPRVSYEDIELFQAYSYFHQGDFAGCLGKIQMIDGAYTVSLSAPNISTLLLAKLEALASAQD